MATFVGAEYIIANVLIALKRVNNKEVVTLDELNKAGIYIQKQSLKNSGIDAIFLSSSEQFVTALYDFSDYFEYNHSNNSIRIVKTKDVSDLEARFIGYLPFQVLSFLVDITKKFVKQSA